MAYLTQPYILYSIRTNIFRQSMNKIDLTNSWKETKKFLNVCTHADLENPSHITLKIFPIFNRKHLDEDLNEILLNSDRPSLEPIWNIKVKDLETVFISLEKLQPFMPSKPNSIELSIYYNFKFADIFENVKLSDQECNSSINFIFSKTHSCIPCLVFPFLQPTIEFWNYLDIIKQYLPFNLDEKLLRLVNVKNGSISSFKKIGRP